MNIVPLIIVHKDNEDIQRCVNSLNYRGLKPHILFQNGIEKIIDGQFMSYTIEDNLGCAGARQYIYELTKEYLKKDDYILFIDDDAELISDITLDDNYNVFAFKSVLGNGKVERAAIPRTYFTHSNISGEVMRITGVAFIVKKHVFEKSGGFHNYYPYGYEDADWSLQIYRMNEKIYYNAKNIVQHYKSDEEWVEVRKLEHEYAIVRNKYKYLKRNFTLVSRLLGFLYWTIRFKRRGYSIVHCAKIYRNTPLDIFERKIGTFETLKIFISGGLIVW